MTKSIAPKGLPAVPAGWASWRRPRREGATFHMYDSAGLSACKRRPTTPNTSEPLETLGQAHYWGLCPRCVSVSRRDGLPATRAGLASLLADGPVYLRSLARLKPMYTAMFDSDEVAFVEPEHGYGRNMCALTTTGVVRYRVELAEGVEPEPSRADLIAALADRVADGQPIDAAGRAIGITRVRARSLWKRFRDQMGEQAA